MPSGSLCVSSPRFPCLFLVLRLPVWLRPLVFSLLVSRLTLVYPLASSHIVMLVSLTHSRKPYGHFWVFISNIICSSTHKQMAKLNWSTKTSFMLSTYSSPRPNNGTLLFILSNIATIEQSICLIVYLILKPSMDTNLWPHLSSP